MKDKRPIRIVRSCYGLVRDDVHGTRLSIGDYRRYVAVPCSLSERRDAIGNGKFYYLGDRYWGLIAKNKNVFKIWMKGAPLKCKVLWAMRLSRLYLSMWWSDHSFRRHFHICYICVPPGHSMTGRPYESLDPNVNGGLTFSDGDRVFGWDYGHYRNRLDYKGDLKRAYRYFKRYEKEGDGR